jgi:hypothetical protein
MPLSPGAILFTSNLAASSSVGGYNDTFSFIATETIPSGTVIRFWDVDTSPNYVDYTVGPNGLSAFDRVTIANTSNTFETLHDPSYASPGTAGLSAMGGSGSSFTITSSSPLMASSDQGGGAHEVIAAINNNDPWDEDLASTGVGRTLIDAYAGSPSPVLSSAGVGAVPANVGATSTNLMYAGSGLSGYNDPANWIMTNLAVNHETGTVGSTSYASQDTDIVCFLEGTLIATETGERCVEDLGVGDRIRTADGHIVAVKWIGRMTVSTRFGPAERLMPVRFAAGSLGDGLPHTDLTVTADHGMLVGGIICHAGALVNGTTITRVPLAEMGETYTVYHVETEEHEIILANGAPAETFIDNVSRRVFDNFAEFEALYGDVPEMEELPYPRAMSARQVPERLKVKLAGQRAA